MRGSKNLAAEQGASRIVALVAIAMAGAIVASACRSHDRGGGDERTERDEVRTAPAGTGRAHGEPPSTQPSEPRASTESAKPTPRRWSFEKTAAGALPAGWSAPSGRWRVEKADKAPSGSQVLAQNAANRSSAFNVALAGGVTERDVEISVRLRARKGRIDQGGGVVWRARDGRNYYVVRYNPLEDNYRVYYVKRGRRRQLGSATVKLDHQTWHTLRVKMVGDRIECFLDGEKRLDVRDETFRTAAAVGLWTKADARTAFDDLTVTGLDRSPLDAKAIGRIAGAQAKIGAGGVVRVMWPRSKVEVTVDGMHLTPAAGLTSWAGFAPSGGGGAMLMGDTVVFEDEVSPAIDAAFAKGLQITALHNHFFYDRPKVYFMHIGGRGDPLALARGVKGVWSAIRAVRRERPQPASAFAGKAPASGGKLDAAAIGKLTGIEPKVKGGVVKVSIGRKATMHGARVGGAMGLTTWAAFSGSDRQAAIDGDFAMSAAEVQPVLRALRRAEIHIVALHNHMIGEQPAYFFTHFWAKGPAAKLARGFRSALDAQREASASRQ